MDWAKGLKTMLVTMVALVVLIVPWSVANKPQTAEADVAQGNVVVCAPIVDADIIRILGKTCVDVSVPLVETTIKVPGPTIRISGPTIRVPGPTIRVPAPTETVTVRVPGQTRTVTAAPENRPQRTAPVQPAPTANKTVTAQPGPVEETASAPPSTKVETKTKTKTETKTQTVLKRIGLGVLASITLFILGLLAYIAGYFIGRKSGKDAEQATVREAIHSLTRIRSKP